MRDCTGLYTVYEYLGPGYVIGIPARDLRTADLVEIGDREGITRAEVEASGIYRRMTPKGVAPFCGVEIAGGRCRETVSEWGERCEEHGGDCFAGLAMTDGGVR